MKREEFLAKLAALLPENVNARDLRITLFPDNDAAREQIVPGHAGRVRSRRVGDR